MAALHQAIDCGVNFIDTADVYGNGRSERLIARLRKERKERDHRGHQRRAGVCPGRRSKATAGKILAWIEDSLRNFVERLDLLQLHGPPTELYSRPEVFGILDDLVKEGKIRYYGVSVEKVEEAMKAIEFPNVQTVQIIFNAFRQRPAEVFFARAEQKKVGILARVPLASGLLTGEASQGLRLCRGRPPQFQSPRCRSLTWARHFREWTTKSGSQQWKRFAKSCLPGSR